MAVIIDGNAISQNMLKTIAADVEHLKAAGKAIKLVAIQVGDNPAIRIYAGKQAQSAESVGMAYELQHLPADTTAQQLEEKIRQLNDDNSTTGILLQMPLPAAIDARKMQVLIAPEKDVESVHPVNMGKLVFGEWIVAPCTPMAAVTILRSVCSDLTGKEVVVIGHSDIVGKPIATILLESRRNAPTVTVCHVATKDLAAHTRKAEILIVATGASQARWLNYRRLLKNGQKPPLPDLRPLVTGDMIRDGAIVIDVGVNRIPRQLDSSGEPTKNVQGKADMKTVGDVDFESCSARASAITPVPGGVGPVTVAMLLKNTVSCAKAER